MSFLWKLKKRVSLCLPLYSLLVVWLSPLVCRFALCESCISVGISSCIFSVFLISQVISHNHPSFFPSRVFISSLLCSVRSLIFCLVCLSPTQVPGETMTESLAFAEKEREWEREEDGEETCCQRREVKEWDTRRRVLGKEDGDERTFASSSSSVSFGWQYDRGWQNDLLFSCIIRSRENMKDRELLAVK